MKKTAQSLVIRVACLHDESNVLIICGKHNSDFAGLVMMECYKRHAFAHLWQWDENLLQDVAGIDSSDASAKVSGHARSLLENADVVFWFTQFEDPKNARTRLGSAICSFWDEVYEIAKRKPLLLINLLSTRAIESVQIDHERYLDVFASSVNVDYRRLRKTATSIRARLNGRKSIHVTDPNGTDLGFNNENRRVGIEVGTLEDCFSTGEYCEAEIPAGEVYVSPIENSAQGRLVVDNVRDFGVERLVLNFEKGRIVSLAADKGEAEFREFLEAANGEKDALAEFGVGINHRMKPIGLRIFDEKALGTVHLAVGNNIHLGGLSRASIHFDFLLYNPTVRADNNLIIGQGHRIS
jgi:leucyl aminopeptidase (aminopeptidase T)